MALFLAEANRPRSILGALPGLEVRQHHVACRSEQGVVVVAVTTAQLFEDVVADGLQQELLAGAAQPRSCDVVLDLQEVKVVSSAAISAIAQLRDFVQRRGRRLVLCGVCPCVAESFRLRASWRRNRASIFCCRCGRTWRRPWPGSGVARIEPAALVMQACGDIRSRP